MAFILTSKQNGKAMKVIGSQLESQKTTRTATIFADKMAKVFESEMSEQVQVNYIQVNRVQELIINNSNGYIQRSTLNKLEKEYMGIWGLA